MQRQEKNVENDDTSEFLE
ncbi:unnamed protein product [Larinioides sclopetarius]|uniref:Uncharacterized protein n=2 Tax=Larinioides sclopetarius TaxID=280406 RepID=A0AAV2ALP5_9ARAC